MNAGPSQLQGTGRLRPRNGIGLAGAAGLPAHKNKSRRVMPLPIKVKLTSRAPERVNVRERNRRAPQLELSVTARTAFSPARAGEMQLHVTFNSAIAIRNLVTRRSDGIQMARSAAARISSDSMVVNQHEIWCPDSCQMISGSVLPITAPQAINRGHELDVTGVVAGFICLADIAAAYDTWSSATLSFSSSGISPTSPRRDCIAAGI